MLGLVAANPGTTIAGMASKLGVSAPTVARAISRLKGVGALARVGSPRTGFWVVADDDVEA